MVLSRLGGGIALALVGCRTSADDTPVDATTADAEPPVPCEPGKVCVDLSRPSSGTLAQVGGTHKISVPGDQIIIVRVSETELVTLSAVCTHKRCSVRYTAGTTVSCPCHGSVFELDGSVVQGPALLPLRVYDNVFDPATNILTITL